MRKNVKKIVNQVVVGLALGFLIILVVIPSVMIRRGINHANEVCSQAITYTKEKLDTYINYESNERTKDLIGLQDKVQGFADFLRQGVDDQNALEQYAKDQRMQGVAVLDENMNPVMQWSKDPGTFAGWENLVQKDSIQQILEHPEKVYMTRAETEEEVYDIAVVARKDASGVVLGYIEQDKVIEGVNDIEPDTFFDGLMVECSGFLAISKGDTVAASNQELREGMSAAELEEISRSGVSAKEHLRKVRYAGKRWYLRTAQYQDYRIYIMLPFHDVYESYYLIGFLLMLLYVIFCGVIVIIYFRAEKQSIDALKMAKEAADSANRAKSTFLNSMSHDIRTPMNAIVGYTALAQTHIDDPNQVQDYLAKISTSSTHLLSLINDILDMSRIESGTVKLDEKPLHIPDLLHDLRTMIQSLVNAKSLNLFIDTQDVIHEDVLTDKLRLNQVLLNIVGNAIKFTQPGGDIIIRLVEKPCTLKQYATYEFSVKDNGAGMSKEFIGHIFDTFSREYSATVSGIQGTGLGMAITKNIVDMMGGEITVESEVGKGSLFTVTLSLRLAGEIVKSEPIPELLGARALVVDDDMNTCRSVSKMLRDIEMRPDWTTSGKEAIMHAQDAAEMKDEYKVYIIDYLMPDMNGIETVRQIRKVIREDVPIIVLTAYEWTDFEDEARAAGVTAFVSKPIFLSELRAVLTQPAGGVVPGQEEGQERNYDYSGKRILLVEDNELNREIATVILEEIGITVDSVNDGDEAVAAVHDAPADRYDLIFMDIQMPRMDGYTATREIRTLPDNRKANIPIVAMTANAFDEDRRKAFEAGMNEHITKPISVDEIGKVLDEIFY